MGERKRSSVDDLTSGEAQSGRCSDRQWRTTVTDGGVTSPWRIWGASGSAVGELRRAWAWARAARAGALGRRK
jgi:hypothetical protein